MRSGPWDPFEEPLRLREALSNLFEERSAWRREDGRPGAPLGLPVDVWESPDAFHVEASIPGVTIEITVLGDVLRIRGEYPDEQRFGDASHTRWLIRERRIGPFERTITFPTAVESDDATAEFNDGVLRVTLPKSRKATPRGIPVRRGSGRVTAHEIEIGESDESSS
jgi:HSP20 family protein